MILSYILREKVNKVKLTKIQSAYIGGIIDAEGTIGFYHVARSPLASYSPRLRVTNRSLEFLEHIQSIIGGQIRKRKFYVDKRINQHLELYEFAISRAKDLYSILIHIQNYLIIKKQIAIAIINYLEERLKHKRNPLTHKELALLKTGRSISLFINQKGRRNE